MLIINNTSDKACGICPHCGGEIEETEISLQVSGVDYHLECVKDVLDKAIEMQEGT